jgi:diguanylate cyclase (GGDEF)-like protein
VQRTAYRTWLRQWWHVPIRYDWLRSYLAARGLERSARYSAAVLLLGNGLLVSLMIFSSAGPAEPVGVAVSIGVTIICAGFSISWAVRWPTVGVSKIFVLGLAACVAALFLAQKTLEVDGTGIIGFALVNTYAACVHTRRFLAAPVGVALVVIGCYLAHVVEIGDPARAVSDCALYVAVAVLIPLCFQFLVYLLSRDADESDFDPLTALPNRRGFDRAVRQLVGNVRGCSAELAIVMIDLDGFKSINDTYGHTVGDDVLIVVGDILRRTCRGSSAFARIGGEEFVIAYVGDSRIAFTLAEHVRKQFADTQWRLTASFGIASTRQIGDYLGDIAATTERLLRVADELMYTAKRAGGDRVESVGFGGESDLHRVS